MTPRELMILQQALYAVSKNPALQQRIFDAVRDAVYAIEIKGADAPTSPTSEESGNG